jgi:hypothetical protein
MKLARIGGETGFPGERLVEFREVTYRIGKKAGLGRQVGRRAFHGKGCLFYLYSNQLSWRTP